MLCHTIDDIDFYHFEILQKHHAIVHAVTSRCGNAKNAFFSMRSQPNLEIAIQNRTKICEILGISAQYLALPSQVHGNGIDQVIQKSIQKGKFANHRFEEVDGLVTNLIQVPLMAQSADCPLIGIYDPVQNAIGIAHAGWRGTVSEMAICLVKKMQDCFQSKAFDLKAVLSPAIGPCCYVVGEEVIEKAKDKPWAEKCFLQKQNSCFFDLWTANEQQLVLAGILPENIESAHICTKCNHERFFSYRVEQKGVGHFALILCINEKV